MSQLKTEQYLAILQGKIPIKQTSHKGFCTAGTSISIVDTALQKQTGVASHIFNPSSPSVQGSCVGERKPKKKKTDLDFQQYLKKYINAS